MTPRLGPLRKSVYSLGDVTINTGLSALGIVYASYFLPQVAELRPALAGLVPLVGRAIDAFTDPVMGRISDHTRWKGGRRRPYFLIGAIPYGASFALLWSDAPFSSQYALFAYYAAAYSLLSVSMTVLSVPYLAIQPEMALTYDARTSLNTYRTVGAMIGTGVAVTVKDVAEGPLGGGPAGFAMAGVLFGFAMAVPWLAVWAATFERPQFQTRGANLGIFDGARVVMSHANFTRLTAIYIVGRISMDLASALIVLYVSFWLGRPEDFLAVMGLFLVSAILALPIWLRISAHRDKARVFILGSVWWASASLLLLLVDPSSPRWIMFAYVPLVGFGYAVVDLMPWSMVGEVIDEDDLETGERREGLYNGVFTFVRKLGGALGVFLVLSILDAAGSRPGSTTSSARRTTS